MNATIHNFAIGFCRLTALFGFVTAFFAGCGSGSSTTYTVTVTISPTSATINLDGKQQFKATASGAANTAVTWEVNGTSGGSSTTGTITTSGLYTAPSTFPNPNTITVTAISQANTADLANASVNLVSGVTVSVSPASVNIQLSKTQQFTATVTGSSNTGVTWQVAGVNGGNSSVGTISSSGLYTAPSSATTPLAVSISAVSDVDATKSASASVVVHGAITVAVSPNSARVQTFHSQQFAAQVSGASTSGVTWQVNGITGGNSSVGTISTEGIYTAPSVVPTSASGNTRKTTTVSVTAISQQDSTATGSAIVTVVAPNQAQQKIPVFLGTSGGSARDSGSSGSCCGGTLGALVSRGGQQYILSTNHVLARSDQGTAGDNILQPGLIDNSCASAGATTVSTLAQFASLENPAAGAPVVDAALALASSGTVDPSGTIIGLGATTDSFGASTDAPPLSGSGKQPAVNDSVVKSGRSTGVSCSFVSAVNLTASVEYVKECGTGPAFFVTFTDLVEISGSGFSAEGDSGALIVEQADATPVALLVGSSDSDSIANPITDVLAALANPNTGEKPVVVGATSPHPIAVTCPTPSSNLTSATNTLETALSADKRQSAAVTLERHSSQLLALSHVNAVGVGASIDEPGQAALLLFVDADAPRAELPVQVETIRTRIVETGSPLNHRVLRDSEIATALASSISSSTASSLLPSQVVRATSVLRNHKEELLRIGAVQGVGVTSSSDSPGDAAILIHVIRGVAREAIPTAIDGVRTRIRESTRFRASAQASIGQKNCSTSRSRTLLK